MKKMKYFWGCLLIISIISTSCSENDDLNDIRGNAEGKYVEFALRRSSTRTIYDDQDGSTTTSDDWQINWEENDPIRIYCAQAQTITQSSNADASYKVTGITANNGSLTKINENALQWGTAPTHDFFAVFPDDGKKIADYDHTNKIITFNFNANQTVKEVKEVVDGNYIAVPDMNNACMVASTIGVQNGKTVNLEFDPIMTTLEINVKGQGNTTASVITGVSIITTFKAGESVISGSGTFQYDIVNKKINSINNSDASTQTIFVELPYGIELTGNKTLNITAFIPPVTLTKDNTKIQVHSVTKTGDDGTVGVSRLALPIQIDPSHKKILNLPNLPSPISNNWITPLDDNIYVSQLSIPGTHDAATGNGFDGAIIKIVGSQFGQTQTFSLAQQWKLGIRCFDLRPAEYNGGVQNYHGLLRTNSSFYDTLKMISDQLVSEIYKDEFAIILMRHESEIDDLPLVGEDQTNWKTLVSEVFQTIKNEYGNDIFVDFKPDLTIGECRGKILVLSRNEYDNGPLGGYITGWGHDSDFSKQQGGQIRGTSSTGTLFVQDFYNMSAEGAQEKKLNSIKTMLNFSKTLHTDDNHKNTWVINHLSGYTETIKINLLVTKIDTGLSTTDGYRANSAYNNDDFYNLITATDWKGSTGIVLMDFIGTRNSGNYTVYGDILTQAIIDNNYKYVMKRKTE